MIVQEVHCWERTFAIGDEHIGGHRVVTAQADLDLTCLIALALLLEEDLGLKALGRRGRRREHTVENLLTGRLAPSVKVAQLTMSPCEGIGEVGNQRVGIDGQVTHKLIFLALLGHSTQATEQQDACHSESGLGKMTGRIHYYNIYML